MGNKKHLDLRFIQSIKRQRKAKDISQERLAEMVGLSRYSIIRLEKARMIPRYDNMVKICRVLDLQIPR